MQGAAVAATVKSHNKKKSAETLPSGSIAENAGVILLTSNREALAAHSIQNAWRKKKAALTPTLDTKNFLDRLHLEKELLKGAARLILFAAVFVLLMSFTSVGIPASSELGVSTVIQQSLDLTSFGEIETLQGLKEFLPALSSSIKEFSASSSNRFPDQNSIQLLDKRHAFLAPRVLQGLDLPVDGVAFSISAWVEVKDKNARGTQFVLRKPFGNNRERSCWGWATPGEVRFGAHDFHTLEARNDGEEITSIPAGVPSVLSHEALVVADNTAAFYRNGNLLGQVELPRALTDCGDKELELGSAGLALASVKFYARALQPNEIEEVFSGGQPLSELATGSVLPQYEHDSIQQVEALVLSEGRDAQSRLDAKAQADHVTSSIALSMAKSLDGDWPAPFTNDDPSPPAVLPDGVGLRSLPADQRRKWEDSPRLVNVSEAVVNEWRDDDAFGPYWSALDRPVYFSMDTIHTTARFPELPAGTTTTTVSFWHRALNPDLNYGISLKFMLPSGEEHVWLYQEGFYAICEVRKSNEQVVSHAKLGARWDPDQQRIDARFVYAVNFNSQQPGAVCWRHVSLEINYESRELRYMMDGRLFDRFKWGDVDMPALDFLRGAELSFNWVWGFAYPDVEHGGAVADVRVYPRGFTEAEHLELQDSARWPGAAGSLGERKRQCVDPARDWDHFDSTRIDGENHDCSWYAEQMLTTPQVCQTTTAQRMCPVTCAARRECHDGSWYEGYTAQAENKYRVFDRVMHLKPPSDESTSVICPSNKVDVAQVLKECRDGTHPPRHPDHYRNRHQRVIDNWSGFGKTDIADCDELERVLDAAQCEWDGSWLDDFQAEVKTTQAWSMSFWARAVEGSKGMPFSFWFSFHFFRSLASPFSLVDWFTLDPTAQSWATVAAPGTGSVTDAHIYPLGCCTELASEWTFFYAQLEPQADGNYLMSGAINGIPLGMRGNAVAPGPDGSPIFVDETFLEALEVTTEMLISPIEFSAHTRGPAEVQTLYYQQRNRIQNLPGSRFSELERASARGQQEEKETGKFDAAMLLVAPPLLFQTRRESTECASPVLGAQLDLIRAVHCPPGACPSLERPESVFSCLGDDMSTERYFGREATELGGEEGFSDFLYTFADNPVVVRDGVELPTDAFLDGRTASLRVLALLQSPSNGLLTVLELRASVGEGGLLSPSVDISHFGGLDAAARRACLGNFVAFIACVALLILLNLRFLYGLYREGRRRGEMKTAEVAEAACDILVAFVLIAFGAVWLPFLLESADKARELETRLASVPFASAEVSFDDKITTFFAAVDDLTATLRTQAILESFGFAMLIVMLLRVLVATSAHPRIGLLTGTIRHAVDDFYHFALLFVLLFYFFSLSATWCFGGEDAAFADLQASMKTQFEMLLGSLPEGFESDNRMIVYVTLSNVVMFFLMLNFLLAIVVEGYMAVREDIEENEVENGVLTDLYITLRNYGRCYYYRWPWVSELEDIIRRSVATKTISAEHLRIAGLSPSAARSVVTSYAEQEPLRRKHAACRLDLLAADALCTAAPAPPPPRRKPTTPATKTGPPAASAPKEGSPGPEADTVTMPVGGGAPRTVATSIAVATGTSSKLDTGPRAPLAADTVTPPQDRPNLKASGGPDLSWVTQVEAAHVPLAAASGPRPGSNLNTATQVLPWMHGELALPRPRRDGHDQTEEAGDVGGPEVTTRTLLGGLGIARA